MGDDLQSHPNWNAILQWSLRFQDGDNQPNVALSPMDDERRQFLVDAISEAREDSDPVSHMKRCVGVIKDPDSTVVQCSDALDELAFYAEDMDQANDLYLIGGLHVVTAYLNHKNTELQWRACEVIANATQNNEKVMAFVTENSILPDLLNMVDESPSDIVRVKSLYAVSCLIRGYKAAQDMFNKAEGYNVLIRALQSDIQKLKVKVLFLIRDICTVSPDQGEVYLSMGIVEELFVLLSKTPHDIVTQQAILLLDKLSTLGPEHLPDGAKVVLESLVSQLDEDAHRKELAVCQNLLQLCSSPSTPPPDR